jgi:putative membrane protein
MWLIWLIIIGVLIYFLIQRSKGSLPAERGSGETPMEILKRRYAAGELSAEEFETRKNALESD